MYAMTDTKKLVNLGLINRNSGLLGIAIDAQRSDRYLDADPKKIPIATLAFREDASLTAA